MIFTTENSYFLLDEGPDQSVERQTPSVKAYIHRTSKKLMSKVSNQQLKAYIHNLSSCHASTFQLALNCPSLPVQIIRATMIVWRIR